MKKVLVIVIALVILGSGVLFASVVSADKTTKKVPVEFYKGHIHVGDTVIGAPEHSGGTDSAGCHNASVPYHCH